MKCQDVVLRVGVRLPLVDQLHVEDDLLIAVPDAFDDPHRCVRWRPS